MRTSSRLALVLFCLTLSAFAQVDRAGQAQQGQMRSPPLPWPEDDARKFLTALVSDKNCRLSAASRVVLGFDFNSIGLEFSSSSGECLLDVYVTYESQSKTVVEIAPPARLHGGSRKRPWYQIAVAEGSELNKLLLSLARQTHQASPDSDAGYNAQQLALVLEGKPHAREWQEFSPDPDYRRAKRWSPLGIPKSQN